MDIFFEPFSGEGFCIEVGFFDTVLEIKEKIQKYQNIPVAAQTLIFNGEVLQDESNVHSSDLVHNSYIQLISSCPEKPATKAESSPPLSPAASRVQPLINIPTSKSQQFPLCMHSRGTIRELKENIHAVMETLCVQQLVLYSDGSELQDHWSLHQSGLSDGSEIDVGFMAGAMGSSCFKKLKVIVVLPRCGGKKTAVEVNGSDKVRVLRMELDKLQKCLQFYLPKDGYYFIYKEHVMDEDRSFRWHHVGQGDTIDISPTSISTHWP